MVYFGFSSGLESWINVKNIANGDHDIHKSIHRIKYMSSNELSKVVLNMLEKVLVKYFALAKIQLIGRLLFVAY